ncbi:uncharacterized protein VTP21DRAFT_3498 [Calcarisporiella thermophila]|uniref:uncharacterized protein n=1 Tax=Calcarisporiella thermophila TaxID=911321 RepID=UPI0037449516
MSDKLAKEWAALLEQGAQLSSENELMTIEELSGNNLSNEIIQEKNLRELTRTYIDLLASLSDPQNKNILQSTILLSKDLRDLFINNLGQLIITKDSITCQKAVLLGQKIFPIIAENSVHDYTIVKELMVKALEALHDGYHRDDQTTLISFITEIYLKFRPVSSFPLEILSNLPGMTVERLNAFDQDFSKAKSSRERKSIIRDFLHYITGKSVGEWFKQEYPVIYETSRSRSGRIERRKDILDSFLRKEEESDEASFISELFD